MRRVLAGLCALLVVIGAVNGVGISPAGAVPSAGMAESQFLTKLNQERVQRGLAPLVRDGGLDGVARDWSSVMASQVNLHHRPDLVSQVDRRVTAAWTRLGENVGVGGTVGSLHDAFMNSTGHRHNVLGDYNRLGVGVVVDSRNTIWVTFNFMKGPWIGGRTGLEPPPPPPLPKPTGNVMLATTDGSVMAFGNTTYRGSLGGMRLRRPIVGMAPTPSKKGYWMVASDGGIFSFGDAKFYGSTGNINLRQPIVGMAPTRTGRGYWLVASDGGIFAFGDARFRGSTGHLRLRQPVVGIATTPTGRGYWMVARDGGIFSFGDARFRGSTGGIRLHRPVNGMAPTATGRGYWLVADDGGIFSFGDARFYGSAAGRTYAPITQIARTPKGGGYFLVASDGRVFAFGGANGGGKAPASSPVVAAVAG